MASLYVSPLLKVMAIVVAIHGAAAQTVPEPSFTAKPVDTYAALDHSVTIYCSIANLGRHQVFWNVVQNSSGNTVGDEFTLGPFTNTHASYPRFKIEGDSAIGEFNLHISDVAKSDAGRYICLVHDTTNTMSVAKEFGAKLTVQDKAVAPVMGYPRCGRNPVSNSLLQSGHYRQGDILTLSCSSKGGIPLPELSWVRRKVDDTTYDLPSKTNIDGDVVTTSATVNLSSVDHQSFYKCTESHPLKTTPRICMTPFTGSESLMNVRFKPEVTLTPDVVNVQVFETTKVTLSCTAYANPQLIRGPMIELPVNKTGEYPKGIDDKTLINVEMTIDDIGKDFYCRASNDEGVGDDSVKVQQPRALPTWLILVIIGAIAVVLLIFIFFVSCILCVKRSELEDNMKGPNRSRPTSAWKEDEINAHDGSMIPIEDFQGGQENIAMHETDKTATPNDFETGEAGPRYQNVNEAFQGDDLNPSSSDPTIDPTLE